MGEKVFPRAFAEGKRPRFWEVDIWRGLAVIAMIAFHFLFDLNYLAGIPIEVNAGIAWALGRFAALSFVFLAGLSLSLSFQRRKKSGNANFSYFFKRGLTVFGFGLLVTLGTFLAFPEGTIWFGVLHLIGISIILGYFFAERKWLNAALGAIFILAGLFLAQFSFSFPWLLWLGLYPQGMYTFDYFPLLPWFGVVLLGIAFGNWAFEGGKRKFFVPNWAEKKSVRAGSWLGRNSLWIYLLHQPVLLGVLKLSGVW
ncbi:MAG: heparan-alpha-glucosaminide N-acetyltransferase [Candidatus Diapherotrites archaeon]